MKIPDWLKCYGDTSYRDKKCPSEVAEQVTFFNALKRLRPTTAKTAMHIRNEGKKTPQQAMREKAEGLLSGAADIIIISKVPFICELKRKDHTLCHWEGKQLDFLLAAQESGAFVCVALGYEAALEGVEEWLRSHATHMI